MAGEYKLVAPVPKTGSPRKGEVGALPTPSAIFQPDDAFLCAISDAVRRRIRPVSTLLVPVVKEISRSSAKAEPRVRIPAGTPSSSGRSLKVRHSPWERGQVGALPTVPTNLYHRMHGVCRRSVKPFELGATPSDGAISGRANRRSAGTRWKRD
jgi:hypothetical protein